MIADVALHEQVCSLLIGLYRRHTFVDDALESNDGEESTGDGGGGNGAQNDQTEQATSVASRLALEEEVGAARRGDVRCSHGKDD